MIAGVIFVILSVIAVITIAVIGLIAVIVETWPFILLFVIAMGVIEHDKRQRRKIYGK